MASSGSGYDLSSSTFSPDGRIFQVEYANKAVENSGTSIGIKCCDGIVMGVAKPLMHKMLVSTSGKRIHTVSSKVGCTMTGFIPDGRQVVSRARDEASNYKETYGSAVSPFVLSNRIASYVHYFTLHGALRPFGSTIMLGGYDEETSETKLYMIEPNGVSYSYHACSAGKGRQPSKTELEKLELHKESVSSQFTCEDAVKQITRIIYLLHDENKDKPFELELSWLCKATDYKHVGVPKKLMADAVVWAKEQIEAEEEDGDDEEEEEGDGEPTAMEEG